ncbi:MAG TPA: hypothetical protein VF032_15385 [Thermoleophilaceae bacterium]
MAANPSIDRLFEVDRITLGATHRPKHFVLVPGGKGLNVGRARAQRGGTAPEGDLGRPHGIASRRRHDDAYARLAATARTHGVRSTVDAQGAALAASLGQAPDLVKINAHEAEELLGSVPASSRMRTRGTSCSADSVRTRTLGSEPCLPSAAGE